MQIAILQSISCFHLQLLHMLDMLPGLLMIVVLFVTVDFNGNEESDNDSNSMYCLHFPICLCLMALLIADDDQFSVLIGLP